MSTDNTPYTKRIVGYSDEISVRPGNKISFMVSSEDNAEYDTAFVRIIHGDTNPEGPNEFLYIGNLKDWNRISEMARLKMPTLIITGTHDEIGPACALRMHNALPNSKVVVFPNSSHVPFYEEPEDYFAALRSFLSAQRA